MTNKDSVGWAVVEEWAAPKDSYAADIRRYRISDEEAGDLARRIDAAVSHACALVAAESSRLLSDLRKRAEKAELACKEAWVREEILERKLERCEVDAAMLSDMGKGWLSPEEAEKLRVELTQQRIDYDLKGWLAPEPALALAQCAQYFVRAAETYERTGHWPIMASLERAMRDALAHPDVQARLKREEP